MADILLVEDDRAMARGIETNLQFEGHRVWHVARGDDAIARVDEAAPDLLILDVMLPGASGFEVCRHVRRRDRRLPILMLTARGDDVDKVMGLDLGADDYLTKPFSLSELLARVRALLRRAGVSGTTDLPDTVGFGDVHADFLRFEVTRGREPVHVTVTELALLRSLAAARGAAVSRDALVGMVWGDDVNVSNRTVDTHVLALRQKLEPHPASPRYLLTVHGVGYRLVLTDS